MLFMTVLWVFVKPPPFAAVYFLLISPQQQELLSETKCIRRFQYLLYKHQCFEKSALDF